MAKPGSTAARGYGGEHQRIRRSLLATLAPGTPCPRCGQPMHPSQPLDLDHTDDRTGYQGLAHQSCNRRAGARKGNAARRNAARPKTFMTSRRW
jgi:hypothetical protein